jgi:hypothetical protein
MNLIRALRSIGRELFGFRFRYPIDVCVAAGDRGALPYYVYSDRLFLDDQILDEVGVPLKCYRLLGPRYNPLFVAWWGLFNLERHLRFGEMGAIDRFWTQVEWLRRNAQERDDGAMVWPCYFDWQEGHCRLRAPWISAMYQGAVMSTLVRGYRLGGDERLLKLSQQACQVFAKSIEDGGVRTVEHGRVLYEEYPGYPLPRILDGFLVSLLGLHDVFVETGEAAIGQLFQDGVRGLCQSLPFWDHRGLWSWYGSHGYLSPPHYHAFNRALLSVLGSLTKEAALSRQAAAWNPEGRSWRERAEIYATFVITKNRARLTLPNEKGT